MNPELFFHLRAMSRFIFYVTEEEDRALNQIGDILSKYEKRIQVYNPALGLIPLKQLQADWKGRSHTVNDQCLSIHDALIKMYTEDPREETNFYIITDPERFLPEPHVQRRLLNLAHQLNNEDRIVKVTICIGTRPVIPAKLQRYFEVVYDRGLTDKEIEENLSTVAAKLKTPMPKDLVGHCRGLTGYEINQAVAQSIVKTKKDEAGGGRRIDPKVIGEFKRRQLNKTDLLNYVDVSEFTFDKVGGADRFKTWVSKTKAAWTNEGQKFGLKPPKGVLAVGVWGCGKSLSVKAMGNAWNLPVVQLETGKLRSSGVGESESNVYRAINLIEAVAPCIVWVDEAEKSMSGAASSSQSDAGTTSRMIGILSTWLQETKAPVCLALTANSLKTLPIEFVNRMDERFFFDLPSDDERIQIFKIHLVKNGQDPKKFNLAELAEVSVNMVGREIEQAIQAAMTESFDSNKDGLDHEILVTQLRSKPRIFRTMVDELKEVLEWVGYDPDVQDGIRARFASAQRSEAFSKFRVTEGGDKKEA